MLGGLLLFFQTLSWIISINDPRLKKCPNSFQEFRLLSHFQFYIRCSVSCNCGNIHFLSPDRANEPTGRSRQMLWVMWPVGAPQSWEEYTVDADKFNKWSMLLYIERRINLSHYPLCCYCDYVVNDLAKKWGSLVMNRLWRFNHKNPQHPNWSTTAGRSKPMLTQQRCWKSVKINFIRRAPKKKLVHKHCDNVVTQKNFENAWAQSPC